MKRLAGLVFGILVAIGCGGPGADDFRSTMRELVPLPEGADFDDFAAYGGRYGIHRAYAMKRYFGGDWVEMKGSLNTAAWQPKGKSVEGVAITASPSIGALSWHDERWALIHKTGEEIEMEPGRPIRGIQALRWIDEPEGAPYPSKTMCYVVIGRGADQRIDACNEHVHKPRNTVLFMAFFLSEDRNELRVVYGR